MDDDPTTTPERNLASAGASAVSPARSMVGRDIISMRDFSRDEILDFLQTCERFSDVREPLLAGQVLGVLFFEPSTRTRLSFESAMKRLGGTCVGFADVTTSSSTKGESLYDTIRVVEGYCDIFVIRHPAEGSARLAAEASTKPVINAGDGANQHPTQTLLDLYTIVRRAGRLESLKIAFVGDLKYGRTVHSLMRSLSLFDCEMWMVSPVSLGLPSHFVEDLDDTGASYHVISDLSDLPDDIDILYMTRIQEERFPDPIEYQRVRNSYFLSAEHVARYGEGLTIMHPLPRNHELSPELDSHPGAAYFDQAHHGVTVRKTILAKLLGVLS